MSFLLNCVRRCPVTKPKNLVFSRHSSRFVQGARYLQRLKEDENYCRDAWSRGLFAVLYGLRPMLVPSDDGGKQWGIAWKKAEELKEVLHTDIHIQESIVLNCNSTEPYGSTPKFSINIPAKPDEPDHKKKIEAWFGGSAINGRKAFFIVSKTDARILSQCLALLEWHLVSQFCSNCGERTMKDASGSKRTCPGCNKVHYPELNPVSIVLVTNGDSCLVVRQKEFPKGMYSAIAGFCEPGEPLDTTVRREVAEEVGLEVDKVKFFSSQPWAFPSGTLMLGCHAAVKLGTTDQVILDKAELEDFRWLHRKDVLSILDGGSMSDGTSLWLPPPIAIAHHLLKSWATQE